MIFLTLHHWQRDQAVRAITVISCLCTAILVESLPAAEQEPQQASVKAAKPSAGVAAQKAYVLEPQPVGTQILVGAHNCPLRQADKPQM
jgi:hypothetical protein